MKHDNLGKAEKINSLIADLRNQLVLGRAIIMYNGREISRLNAQQTISDLEYELNAVKSTTMQIGDIIKQKKFETQHLTGTCAPAPIVGKIVKIGRVNVWIEVPYMNGMTVELKLKKELFQ